ncbi:hypothetical protein DIC82_15810 [Clostridium beijerinckii]|nr:hypothetical protein DIC82_15810 [Clostridium beijerinckii]
MKIMKLLTVFLISMILFTEMPKAIPVSNNYKQGIYDVSEFKDLNATAKLLSPSNVTSLIIIDSNSNEKFYKRFDTVNEVITLGYIKEGDFIVVSGRGEISINFFE